jgi:hypothetical protein
MATKLVSLAHTQSATKETDSTADWWLGKLGGCGPTIRIENLERRANRHSPYSRPRAVHQWRDLGGA